PAKARRDRAQVIEHLIKKCLGHGSVPSPIGMRKAVAAGRGGPANAAQFPRVVLGAVADIVEPNGVGQLRQKQAHNMAPRTNPALHLFHPMSTRKLGDKVRRDDFANLTQYGKMSASPLGHDDLLLALTTYRIIVGQADLICILGGMTVMLK